MSDYKQQFEKETGHNIKLIGSWYVFFHKDNRIDEENYWSTYSDWLTDRLDRMRKIISEMIIYESRIHPSIFPNELRVKIDKLLSD